MTTLAEPEVAVDRAGITAFSRHEVLAAGPAAELYRYGHLRSGTPTKIHLSAAFPASDARDKKF